MACQSVIAGCSRTRAHFRCSAFVTRTLGLLHHVSGYSTNSLNQYASEDNLQSLSLESVDNLASRLHNELKLSHNFQSRIHPELSQQTILNNTNDKSIINAGILNNHVIVFPEADKNIKILPGSSNAVHTDLINDEECEREGFQLSSVLKKRRKKMNKHKYKKRIHRDKARIRTVKYFRLRRKKRRQAFLKKRLQLKIARLKKIHPNSDYPDRPYVVFRLKNW